MNREMLKAGRMRKYPYPAYSCCFLRPYKCSNKSVCVSVDFQVTECCSCKHIVLKPHNDAIRYCPYCGNRVVPYEVYLDGMIEEGAGILASYERKLFSGRTKTKSEREELEKSIRELKTMLYDLTQLLDEHLEEKE